MSDVQFDSDQADEFVRPAGSARGFDLTGLFVRWGFAKNRVQAEYVLIGIGIFSLIVMVYMIWGGGNEEPLVPLVEPTL